MPGVETRDRQGGHLRLTTASVTRGLDTLLGSPPAGSGELPIRSGQITAGREDLVTGGPELGSHLPVADSAVATVVRPYPLV